jgi:hypothetical protein
MIRVRSMRCSSPFLWFCSLPAKVYLYGYRGNGRPHLRDVKPSVPQYHNQREIHAGYDSEDILRSILCYALSSYQHRPYIKETVDAMQVAEHRLNKLWKSLITMSGDALNQILNKRYRP